MKQYVKTKYVFEPFKIAKWQNNSKQPKRLCTEQFTRQDVLVV